MGYYQQSLKQVNKRIVETKKAIAVNKLAIKDNSPLVGALKHTIANIHRKGEQATALQAELNLRRSFLRDLNAAQAHNRQYLREMYILRRGFIDEWVASEES